MLSYKFMSLTICLHLHMFWETLVCSVSLFRKNKKCSCLYGSLWIVSAILHLKCKCSNGEISYNDDLFGGVDKMIETCYL